MGILEFKYIKRSDKAEKQTVAQLKEEAVEQLHRYENDSLITQYTKNSVKLKKIVLIFHGLELKVCEEIK